MNRTRHFQKEPPETFSGKALALGPDGRPVKKKTIIHLCTCAHAPEHINNLAFSRCIGIQLPRSFMDDLYLEAIQCH